MDIRVGREWRFDMIAPDGKTVITVRQLHPTKAQRTAGIAIQGPTNQTGLNHLQK
jgi:hypothetical protein